MTQAFNDIFLRSREIQGFRRVRELQEHYKDFLLAAFGLLLVRSAELLSVAGGIRKDDVMYWGNRLC